MADPRSLPLPPIALAHKKFPLESSFCTYTSLFPAEVRLNVPLPGSKSTVPLKLSIVKTLPAASTAIEYPKAFSVSPKPTAHRKSWACNLLAPIMNKLANVKCINDFISDI